MTTQTLKHFITGDELDKNSITNLLNLASELKAGDTSYSKLLSGKNIAIIFEKPSLRTRFSFSAAINQLGGNVIESISQTRKSEEPKDFIRVIQGYCSAMMIRTFDDNDLVEMKQHATIPIINGLTDKFHPCQSLADLLTLKERFGSLNGLTLTYIGDGNNVLHSLMMMGSKMGVKINYCCPENHQPSKDVLEMIENKELVSGFSSPQEAVLNSNAVYADVWTSMGFEAKDENDFEGYQVNEQLMKYMEQNAVFMHCMPMERGKEVSVDLPDAPCSVIFQQSENRMHVQQALLISLLSEEI